MNDSCESVLLNTSRLFLKYFGFRAVSNPEGGTTPVFRLQLLSFSLEWC